MFRKQRACSQRLCHPAGLEGGCANREMLQGWFEKLDLLKRYLL